MRTHQSRGAQEPLAHTTTKNHCCEGPRELVDSGFGILDFTSGILNHALKPQTFCVIAIIFFALIIRLHFFIGFAGGDPQDDGLYINVAKDILQKGFYDHNIQKNLILNNAIVNPIYMFPSRILMTYGTALSFFLFGVNDYSAALFPLICSLLSIYIIYKIGSLLFNYQVGLLAGFFLSIMPIDIIFSTRITPDVPVAFFMMLSIYLFLQGVRADHAGWFVASGIATGVGYLAKESTIPIIVYMAFVAIVTSISNKKFSPKCLFFVFGLSAIICCECLYYQILTGFPTLRFHLIPKILKIKYAQEYAFFTIDLKWLLIKYQPNSLFTHFKTLLNTTILGSEVGLRHFGLFYYPVFISFFWVLFNKINKSWVIISWIILLYLYLEFGPVRITFELNPLLITYELICKYSRFLTMLSAPACLLLAIWLTYWSDRCKYIIACLVICILVQTSYKNVSASTAFFRNHTRDLREAAECLMNLNQRKIYADMWARNMLYYYSGYKLNTPMADIGTIAQNPNSPVLKDSYVILGGARGSGVLAGYFEKNYIDVLKHIPESWIALKKIPGENDSFRSRDLTVYYIPQ